ncbi:MAG: NAD-dependent epimerase/dehydratase family protein [Phycisphaerae bacterium]
MNNVLVTGLSGLVGSAIRERLAQRYTLTALNLRDVPGVRTIQADIADLDAIRPAFVGQDVVVHLAGYRGYEWNDLLRTNIVGVYNVFEAAREAGVKRIVYASSGAVIAGWQREEPYKAVVEARSPELAPDTPRLSHESLPRPTGIYGCTKVWGEALAWDYSQTFALSIICLRIAAVTPEDRPTTSAMAAGWCSQRDLAQIIERCIDAPPTLRFDIFNAVSNSTRGVRDWKHAHEVLGYEPQDWADRLAN